VAEDQASYETSPRIEATVQRIVRNSAMAVVVKNLHDYRCQVCDTRLVTLAGPYAEGAHIQPLGMAHDGPDTPDNLLCLCPNCHVRLDYGAMVIDPDLTVRDTTTQVPIGYLRIHPQHPINPTFLAYHRNLFTTEQVEPQVESTNPR
jgi:predicted restriction endonuclease